MHRFIGMPPQSLGHLPFFQAMRAHERLVSGPIISAHALAVLPVALNSPSGVSGERLARDGVRLGEAARRLARRPEAAGRPAIDELAAGALARERDGSVLGAALSVDPVDPAEHDEEEGDTVHRAARSLRIRV